jgi:hypothetical protein
MGRSVTFLITLSLLPAATVFGQVAPLLEDNTAIVDVPGRSDVDPSTWGDSYSNGDDCYCHTTLDHNIGPVIVTTPLGDMTIEQICNLLGDGPGGGFTGRLLYNDIQCGNGPPNEAGDETDCPGRIEYGQEGCKYIGPKWNFAGKTVAPTSNVSQLFSNVYACVRRMIKWLLSLHF